MKKLLIFLLFPIAAQAQPASSGYLLTNSNVLPRILVLLNTFLDFVLFVFLD